MLTALSAEIVTIAIPFRFGFRHALAERKVGEGVILKVRDAHGRTGHGECAPREYVSGETASSVVDVLSRRTPELLGHRFDSFEALTEALTRAAFSLPRNEHAAFCALELAFLDLGGRAFGRSSGEPLGPVCRTRVEYSGVVSGGGREAAEKACAAMRELGVRRVKVKVGEDREEDLQVLAAVRESLGEDAKMRVDANGAWDCETALERLRELQPFALEGCEQPCAAEDLKGMAWLAERSPVPVIADESLVSIEDARKLAKLGACHVFNVRISKCGGLLAAGRIRDLGREAGIASMLGAHVGETAILAAAGRQFASRTPGLRFAEGSYGKLLLEEDVSDALDLGPGGVGETLTGSGLGLEVDCRRIEPHIVSRARITA